MNKFQAIFQFTALPQPPGCWNCRHVLFCAVCFGDLYRAFQPRGQDFPLALSPPSPLPWRVLKVRPEGGGVIGSWSVRQME